MRNKDWREAAKLGRLKTGCGGKVWGRPLSKSGRLQTDNDFLTDVKGINRETTFCWRDLKGLENSHKYYN